MNLAMKRPQQYRCVAAAAVSALLVASTAGAQTIVQNYTIPSQVIAGPISSNTEDGETILPIVTTLALPFERFDTTLGTLDSVDWDYEFNFLISGNVGPNGGNLGASVGGNFYLDPLQDNGVGSFSGNGGGNGTGAGVMGPLSVSFSVSNMKTLALSANGPSFDFLSAAGGGMHQFEWVWSPDDDSELSAGSFIDDVTLTLTGGHNNMTFHYTPVPEPTGLALLCLGAAGMCQRRRNAGR